MVVSTIAWNKEFVRGTSNVSSQRDINVYSVVVSFVEQRQLELSPSLQQRRLFKFIKHGGDTALSLSQNPQLQSVQNSSELRQLVLRPF